MYSACLATQPVQQNFRDLFDDDDFNRQVPMYSDITRFGRVAFNGMKFLMTPLISFLKNSKLSTWISNTPYKMMSGTRTQVHKNEVLEKSSTQFLATLIKNDQTVGKSENRKGGNSDFSESRNSLSTLGDPNFVRDVFENSKKQSQVFEDCRLPTPDV